MDQLLKHLWNKDAAMRNNKEIIEEKDESKYSQQDIDEACAILSIYDASFGLDSIRTDLMNSHSKHGNLKFGPVDHKLTNYLKSLFTFVYIFFLYIYSNKFKQKN